MLSACRQNTSIASRSETTGFRRDAVQSGNALQARSPTTVERLQCSHDVIHQQRHRVVAYDFTQLLRHTQRACGVMGFDTGGDLFEKVWHSVIDRQLIEPTNSASSGP
jgi:hypothetical protein